VESSVLEPRTGLILPTRLRILKHGKSLDLVEKCGWKTIILDEESACENGPDGPRQLFS